MTRRPEREIEAVMSARLGRPCLFTPSGRLAIYVALRWWLRPGGRILMSPLNDDVVFFVVLAAGLRPVMAPVSPDDGNIDPGKIDEGTWSRLDGVLTTNLYGLPDRIGELRSRCDQLRIPLIEDAAHAIQTEVDDRPIGSFGEASAFSLSKHVRAPCGGVLAFGDDSDRPELERLRDSATAPARWRDLPARVGAQSTKSLVVGLGLVWPVRLLRRRLGLTERTGYRMPLRAAALRRAAAAPGLEPFDQWVRVDRHDYGVRPSTPVVEWALRRLRKLDAERGRRLDGVSRLCALPSAAPAVRKGDPRPLFRVPLLVENRAAAIARVERQILGVGYIYDPPLDDYAGAEFAEPSPAPEVARRWARQVLPVDPLEADAILCSARRRAGGDRAVFSDLSAAAEIRERPLEEPFSTSRDSSDG